MFKWLPSNLFCIFLCASLTRSTSLAEVLDLEREMSVGESFDVKMAKGESLSTPKRSIVESTRLSPEQLRITALKIGFEILQLLDAQGMVKSRILLKVKKTKETCKGDCLLRDQRMVGESRSFEDWIDNADDCRRRRCQFEQKLTTKAQQDLLKKIKEFDSRVFDFKITGANRIEVRFHCTDAPLSENISHLLKGFIIMKHCQQPSSEHYRLRAKVILVDESGLSRLGMDWTRHDVFSGRFTADFAAIQQDHEAITIGEPEAMIMVGESIYLHSGGEIHSSGRYEDQWKTHGLELEANLHRAQDLQLVLATDLKLSSPKGNSDLQSYQLKSKVLIRASHTVYAGRTSLASVQKSDSSLIGIDSIPIIGPLLRQRQRTELRQWICLWLRLESPEKDDVENKSKEN